MNKLPRNPTAKANMGADSNAVPFVPPTASQWLKLTRVPNVHFISRVRLTLICTVQIGQIFTRMAGEYKMHVVIFNNDVQIVGPAHAVWNSRQHPDDGMDSRSGVSILLATLAPMQIARAISIAGWR
jgi:hypothetical protein